VVLVIEIAIYPKQIFFILGIVEVDGIVPISIHGKGTL